MKDYIAIGSKYADDVVSGKILACKQIKQACQRHINDLKASSDMGYKFYFDHDRAISICKFIELMPHTKGKWARDGSTISMEPWQCFKTMCIAGWLEKATDMRRFRRVFILEPRKNAKSTWAAALGLALLTIDNEYGAEIYSGATTEKQAWEVFKPARLMAKKAKGFKEQFGLQVNAQSLTRLQDGAKFEPLIGNPGDGSSPSCAIIDEYHEHDTDKMVDTMETGMGAREQPLLLIITTAGDNIAGPCYAYQKQAERMLDGLVQDDRMFALIYTVNKNTKWDSVDALRMANPNMGVSVGEEYLIDAQQKAINDPRKIGIFKTKHLNIWVQAKDAYFNTQRWQQTAIEDLRIEQFHGEPVILALDLASKYDIAAKEYLFKLSECSPENETVQDLIEKGFEYAQFGVSYLPEETVDEPENEHYQGWREEGLIQITEGEAVDYQQIKEDIVEDRTYFNVLEVAFDEWQARMMMSELMELGFNCIQVGQTVKNMSEPMKELDAMIRKKGIAHNGNPVYTWQLSCVLGKHDFKDNVFPNKDKNQKQNKIDNPVATMMAMARWLVYEDESSVYETRGILTV